MRTFGLIGYPLTHSFSKRYFIEKFEREGIIDAMYELYPIKDIREFPNLIRSTPALVGMNVTIPYKQEVLQYIDSREYLPQGLDACNCIKIKNGRTFAYNTDVIGFEKCFLKGLNKKHHQALILGNGGATAAVAYVLKRLNISFDIVSRKIHDGSRLTYEMLDQSIMKSHTVIINTTPLGMYPQMVNAPAIPYQFISRDHYLFDLIYNPTKTEFLRRGEENGAITQNGFEMLEIQAEESWKIWNSPS